LSFEVLTSQILGLCRYTNYTVLRFIVCLMSSDQLEVGIDDVNWVERMCPDSQTPVKKITIEWQLFELCTFYCIRLINLTQRKQRHVGWADSDDVSLQGQECIC